MITPSDQTIVTRELVNQYIESAHPFVQSMVEQLAIVKAKQLNSAAPENLSPGLLWEWKSEPMYPKRFKRSRSRFTEEDQEEARTLQSSILKEIHIAVCTRSRRYRKYVETVRDNANILIGMIAIRVAQTVGVAVAVITALVAALLRIVFEMGVAVFCNRFAAQIEV